MKYILILISLVFIACSQEAKTILIGSFDTNFSDTLMVMDFVRTDESFEEIIVKNGKFSYSILTETPDIRVVTNKAKTITFNFITEPGKYTINFTNNNYKIDGVLNNRIKDIYDKSSDLMNEKKMMFMSGKDSILKTNSWNQLESTIKAHLLKSTLENKDNPISAVTTFAFHLFLGEENPFFDTLYSHVDTLTLNNTSIGKALRIRKARNQRPKSLPNVDFFTINSNTEAINTSKDYLFIDFWASWCKPCRAQIPNLKAKYQKYRETNKVDFLSVSIWDNKDAWEKAVAFESMPWKQLIYENNDDRDLIEQHWGILSIPHGVLINKNGETVENYITNGNQLDSILSVLMKPWLN